MITSCPSSSSSSSSFTPSTSSNASNVPQPLITLNNGLTMPQLGLGTRRCEPGEIRSAVYAAIKCGYRHIDNAWIYSNEAEVGDAIKQAIEEKILVRSDLFITSKLWNTFHRKEDVEASLRGTLQTLGLEEVDLYLIHWPVSGIESTDLYPPIKETWLEMEKLVALGLTKSIGVSNWSVSKLREMSSYATIFPAVNQVEVHPVWRQDELIKECMLLGKH